MMSLFGHSDSTSAGLFSPDGKTLFTVSNDKTTRIWELKTQSCKFVMKGHKYHKADILCITVAKSKPMIATGSGFNEVGLVNYESGSVSFLLTIY